MVVYGTVKLQQSAPAFAQNVEQPINQRTANSESALNPEPIAIPRTSHAILSE